MAKTYEVADGATIKLMQQILAKAHAALKDAKVKVGVIFAAGEEGEPAVKEAGYNTFGKVKIFADIDRKDGAPDARLIIDKTEWENADADQRVGMLDHLLHRLEVRKTDKGEVIRDGTGRPKLNRRKYDLRLAGYSVVIQRNAEHAPEAIAAKQLKDSFGQLLMWSENPELVG